jgi:hypothetical protein
VLELVKTDKQIPVAVQVDQVAVAVVQTQVVPVVQELLLFAMQFKENKYGTLCKNK